MTETGIVREINGSLITIAPEKGASCFGCMKTECRSGSGLITAENPASLPLAAGQTVTLRAQNLRLMLQALAVFLPPLLAFTAGYILIRFLVPAAGEGAAAFTGAILLFVTAFVIYRTKKKSPAPNEFVVIRIIG